MNEARSVDRKTTRALRDLESIQRDYSAMVRALGRIALESMTLHEARKLAEFTLLALEGRPWL